MPATRSRRERRRRAKKPRCTTSARLSMTASSSRPRSRLVDHVGEALDHGQQRRGPQLDLAGRLAAAGHGGPQRARRSRPNEVVPSRASLRSLDLVLDPGPDHHAVAAVEVEELGQPRPQRGQPIGSAGTAPERGGQLVGLVGALLGQGAGTGPPCWRSRGRRCRGRRRPGARRRRPGSACQPVLGQRGHRRRRAAWPGWPRPGGAACGRRAAPAPTPRSTGRPCGVLALGRSATCVSGGADARLGRTRGRRTVGRCYLPGRAGRLVAVLPRPRPRSSDEVGAGLRGAGIGEGDVRGARACPPHPTTSWPTRPAPRSGRSSAGVNPRLTDRRARPPCSDRARVPTLRPRRADGARRLARRADAGRAARRRGRRRRPCPTDPDRPVAIVFTSGTTGLPKGAMFTDRQLRFITEVDTGHALGRRRGRPWAATSLAHLGPTTKLAGTSCGAAPLHLVERWRPDQALRLTAEHHMAALAGIPTQLALMLHDPTFADHRPLVASGRSSSAAVPPRRR